MLVYGMFRVSAARRPDFTWSRRFGVGQPYTGVNYTLASITPVILGGTLLSGGKGGVIGTLLGAFLISLLNNLLNFMDVSKHYQLVAQAVDHHPRGLGLRRTAEDGVTRISSSAALCRPSPDRLAVRPAMASLWRSLSHCRCCSCSAARFRRPLSVPAICPTCCCKSPRSGSSPSVSRCVMIVRGLDLSVASMMATAAVIATGFSGTDRDVAHRYGSDAGIAIAVGLSMASRHQAPCFAIPGDACDDDPAAGFQVCLYARRAVRKRAAFPARPRVRQFHGVPYNALVLLVLAVCLPSSCIVRHSDGGFSSSAAIR